MLDLLFFLGGSFSSVMSTGGYFATFNDTHGFERFQDKIPYRRSDRFCCGDSTMDGGNDEGFCTTILSSAGQ
ncbi:hypothetical protein C8R45DRAFT_1013467 [Mycena sanguinolenta]|nr:hypothetical protein C8R45DRAFT_1013467 [Mycena sanguinolenta]